MAGFEFILSSLVELHIPNYVDHSTTLSISTSPWYNCHLLLLLKSISSLLVLFWYKSPQHKPDHCFHNTKMLLLR